MPGIDLASAKNVKKILFAYWTRGGGGGGGGTQSDFFFLKKSQKFNW